MITIEQYKGVNVLRDDLLKGGTKSILMPSIIGDDLEYVYASPVYGGFQIALSAYCKSWYNLWRQPKNDWGMDGQASEC